MMCKLVAVKMLNFSIFEDVDLLLKGQVTANNCSFFRHRLLGHCYLYECLLILFMSWIVKCYELSQISVRDIVFLITKEN